MQEIKFRKYVNSKGKKEEFVVFIIHGKSKKWKKVKEYINKVLNFATLVLIEEANQGNLTDLFKDAVWEECDCAVAIMSPDDQMRSGRYRARQNVLYEIGYCQGLWDHYYQESALEPVIIIKERRVELNSDLSGYKYISYREEAMEKSFGQLGTALENMFYYLDESEKFSVQTKKAKSKSVSRRMAAAK